ncbi:MAG: hypothetical protein EYC71_04845 [Gammaproteobacteria bacterium]|nr:MAG: hypothetical protein EYC71_04845 [Gammaproteobacteria bacterium]
MASESQSIFETIKRGGWEGSLFTTFNATLPFYEDVVLRKLTAVGCRNNVVLMDRRQCALAYASEATRPRMAGSAYTLIPIHVNGAFHPKLALLAGKKRANVFVGSHNLTISGFGYNREVSNCIDLPGAPGTPGRDLLVHAWAMARSWISEVDSDLPARLVASAFALDGVFGNTLTGEQDASIQLIGQRSGGSGLLDQLMPLLPATIKRITVLGAFFDRDGVFLSELDQRWKGAEIIVGIDPSSVWMSKPPSIVGMRVVDAGAIGNQNKNSKHPAATYLHAKAIYFEGLDGVALFASGSANPSAPAWLADHGTMNVEAMLVRHGNEARVCARNLGMDKLAKRPVVATTTLADIATRSRSALADQDVSCPALFVGIADYDAACVWAEVRNLPSFDAVDALGPDDEALLDIGSVVATVNGFAITEELPGVRTLLLRSGTTAVARVLVHHPARIAHLISGAARDSANNLLQQLGSSFDDISRVLPFLEKVIFADSVSGSLRAPTFHAGTTRTTGDQTDRPDSLAIALADIRRSPKSSLFSHSNDLCSLIDILLRHIELSDDATERGVDRVGRSEEEQIGQDDDTDEITPSPSSQEVTDAQIAGAVRQKAAKLVRRMCKAMENTDRAPTSTMTLVVQLLGVMALLRELAHLEFTDRWKRSRTSLVRPEDLDELLCVASGMLLADGSVDLLALSDHDSEPPVEMTQLRTLMLWLAWISKWEWWTPSEHLVNEDQPKEKVLGNAKLLELLRHSANDSELWPMLQQSIERTLPPDPIAAASATRWLERHQLLSGQLCTLTCEDDFSHNSSLLPIRSGDVVSVPGAIDYPTIAITNDGQYVSLGFGHKKKARSFEVAHVRLIARF